MSGTGESAPWWWPSDVRPRVSGLPTSAAHSSLAAGRRGGVSGASNAGMEPAPPLSTVRSHLVWRVFCEGCDWKQSNLASRDEAISRGRYHVNTKHLGPMEWRFRVQGIRTASRQSDSVSIAGVEFSPHAWEPNIRSRNKNLPCGVCRIYRYVHDDIYGYAEVS